MKLTKSALRLLGFSPAEHAVLEAIYSGEDTPLRIATHTKVSRPAVYEIIDRLHARGLIKSNIRNGRKYWSQAKVQDLEQELYNTKKQLFDVAEGVEEIRGLSDSLVTIHRGGEAIRKLLREILVENKDTRLQAIQGDTVVIGWNKVFGIEGTNELNRFIKKNRIIVEGIVPFGWFERQTKALGVKWARDFEGRMAINHEIGEEYFEHGGQIWMFKNSVYFVAMNEEIVVEMRNSEIQKLILAMFIFIQDNSRKFDVNARLRELIEKYKEK
jgi:predicted transcriptional regulator